MRSDLFHRMTLRPLSQEALSKIPCAWTSLYTPCSCYPCASLMFVDHDRFWYFQQICTSQWGIWRPHAFIASFHTLQGTLSPSHNDTRPFTMTFRAFSMPFAPTPGLISRWQAFHFAHPHAMGSSSPPIPLSYSLQWRMLIQPFKEIANWLAYFWSRLSLPSFLRLTTFRDFLPGHGRYRRYRSLREEQRWWDESERTRAFFASSDARHRELKDFPSPKYLSPIPLVTSYVPRLLPRYRDRGHLDDTANEYDLTPSTYRKWHRLVFPHQNLPTRSEAAKLIKYLSMRDRREIARIARLVSDEAAAQKGFSPSPMYQVLWTRWLQHKGPDLVIVFE
ncbi:hypothetical protein F5148DRAFT_1161479 [Russula earlei]|uniref:Uncharacterized protein n=1 Tax=Russula earlei TaxID=71964 RepID=A0ACC0UM69_9AGAM|nr:hypothetical protein F5148DRAFT_1161479 [Russula earlei]